MAGREGRARSLPLSRRDPGGVAPLPPNEVFRNRRACMEKALSFLSRMPGAFAGGKPAVLLAGLPGFPSALFCYAPRGRSLRPGSWHDPYSVDQSHRCRQVAAALA